MRQTLAPDSKHKKSFADPSYVLSRYLTKAKTPNTNPVPTLVQLGLSFSPDAFWRTADRQQLVRSKAFKCLIADVIAFLQANDHPTEVATILTALGFLQYRPQRLMQAFQKLNVTIMTVDSLTLVAHALGILNVKRDELMEVLNEVVDRHKIEGRDGVNSRSIQNSAILAHAAAKGAAGAYLAGEAEVAKKLWTKVAVFATQWANQVQAETANADNPMSLGWSGFLMREVYESASLEGVSLGSEVAAVVREQLGAREADAAQDLAWLEEYGLKGQPVGRCEVQAEMAKAMDEAKINYALNCSVGERGVFFAQFKLPDNVAVLVDDIVGEGVGGVVALKARVMKKMGYKVAVVHGNAWSKLSDEDKLLYLTSLVEQMNSHLAKM
jgi:hypothetical protein